MADPRVYRNCVKALLLLDAKRLRRVARKEKVTLPPDEDDNRRLVNDLLKGLYHPTHFWSHLTAREQDAVGDLLGVGIKNKWRSKLTKKKISALPFYAKPSWEKDVFAALVRKTTPRRSAKRRPRVRPKRGTSRRWPELTKKVTTELARALGDAFEARAAGRIWHREAEVLLIAIPAGKLEMGLRSNERRELEARAERLCLEAIDHAAEIVTTSRPVRTVKIEPFLLAQKATVRATSREAARVIESLGARLPSEAEWEYVARGKGDKSWLSNRTARWSLRDLDWTDWVADGWHPNYRGAPKDGSAWSPHAQPELARGGLMELWPWQSGEAMQMHVAARLHAPRGQHGVRPAWSFPPR